MRVVRQALALAFLIVGVPACGGAPEDAPATEAPREATDTTRADAASASASSPALPWVGVAIQEAANQWCVALAADSLPAREEVTIVFPDSGSGILSLRARIAARRATPCATGFPQLQLAEDAVYDLTLVDTPPSSEAAPVAFAVVSDVRWSRGADGIARADLDGDGLSEEARVCSAHEGQYFSLWKRSSADSPVRPVWGRYFDWGAFVDADCAPGEADETLSMAAPPDESIPAGTTRLG